MPNSFIIIKGQTKALQIERFQMGDNGVYDVKFKSSPRTYHYRYSDVVWLKDAVWHDHLHCKVYIGGREQHNVEDIRSFQHGEQTHWRITFNNGYVQDYLHGSIQVVESCLADDIANNAFEFLKRIAQVNELGMDEEHGGILPSLYEKIDFIDKELSAAPYLNPNEYHVKRHRVSDLIFPFGCNSSQEKAVRCAFENQISVIQGPPGTGKTQTILNIIANILVQGKTVMVVSNNNSAAANVLEKLQKYGLGFIVAPLGKRENKEAFVNNQPVVPDELQTWSLSMADSFQEKRRAGDTLKQLRKVFELQEGLASAKQELKAIELEWEHFKQDNQIDEEAFSLKRTVKSQRIMNLWLRYQSYAEGDVITYGSFGKFVERIKWAWMNFTRRYLLGIKSPLDKTNIQSVILELQALYYIARMKELTDLIDDHTSQLASYDSKTLSSALTDHSMAVLKNALNGRYCKEQRRVFNDVKELRLYA